MPTPFMHLQIAGQIRADGRLSPAERELLEREWPAFYLGSVAADVQTISNAPREATHFYSLPPDQANPAYRLMLAEYPSLADAGRLSGGQAAFVAAYLAHLLLDVCWYWDVLAPYFIQGAWGEYRHRFLVHNTLLTYLDHIAHAALPPTAASTLAAAEPDGWLPFVADANLVRWRDLLVDQLRPGAASQSVAVYARRLGMTPAEFAANLAEPVWMEEHLFRNVPLQRIQALLTSAVGQSLELISDYLLAGESGRPG